MAGLIFLILVLGCVARRGDVYCGVGRKGQGGGRGGEPDSLTLHPSFSPSLTVQSLRPVCASLMAVYQLFKASLAS